MSESTKRTWPSKNDRPDTRIMKKWLERQKKKCFSNGSSDPTAILAIRQVWRSVNTLIATSQSRRRNWAPVTCTNESLLWRSLKQVFKWNVSLYHSVWSIDAIENDAVINRWSGLIDLCLPPENSKPKIMLLQQRTPTRISTPVPFLLSENRRRL